MEGLNLIGTQPFETKRCRVRPFKLGDSQYIFKNWAGDENAAKYSTRNAHKSVEESTAYCIAMMKASRSLDKFHWIIELTETGEPIGEINVSDADIEKREAKINYALGEEWQDKGIMTEAFEAVLAYLIFVIGFDAVTAEFFTEDPMGGSVMEKCGLKHIGTSQITLEQKGGITAETQVYRITKPEWYAKNIKV